MTESPSLFRHRTNGRDEARTICWNSVTIRRKNSEVKNWKEKIESRVICLLPLLPKSAAPAAVGNFTHGITVHIFLSLTLLWLLHILSPSLGHTNTHSLSLSFNSIDFRLLHTWFRTHHDMAWTIALQHSNTPSLRLSVSLSVFSVFCTYTIRKEERPH